MTRDEVYHKFLEVIKPYSCNSDEFGAALDAYIVHAISIKVAKTEESACEMAFKRFRFQYTHEPLSDDPQQWSSIYPPGISWILGLRARHLKITKIKSEPVGRPRGRARKARGPVLL